MTMRPPGWAPGPPPSDIVPARGEHPPNTAEGRGRSFSSARPARSEALPSSKRRLRGRLPPRGSPAATRFQAMSMFSMLAPCTGGGERVAPSRSRGRAGRKLPTPSRSDQLFAALAHRPRIRPVAFLPKPPGPSAACPLIIAIAFGAAAARPSAARCAPSVDAALGEESAIVAATSFVPGLGLSRSRGASAFRRRLQLRSDCGEALSISRASQARGSSSGTAPSTSCVMSRQAPCKREGPAGDFGGGKIAGSELRRLARSRRLVQSLGPAGRRGGAWPMLQMIRR